MLRLRKILLCNFLYYLFLIITIFLTILNLNKPILSKYKNIDTVEGIITKVSEKDSYRHLIVDAKEKVLVILKDKNIKLKLGIKIKVSGNLIDIEKNTVFNNFNYRLYMYSENIYKKIYTEKVDILSEKISILYKIKNIFIDRIESVKNSKRYLYAFLLGDTSYIDSRVLKSYQNNGISHLFAISGMHVTLLSTILLTILKKIKIKEVSRYIITSILLLLYAFISGFSISVIRAVLFFILLNINKINYFYIKNINLFFIVLSLVLLNNSYIIYNTGFQFSFTISFYLLLFQNYFSKYNKYMQILITSIVSLLASIPIMINSFYHVNFISIIYNLFFIPFVSILLFPLTILVFILPFLEVFLNILIYLMENISLFFSNINFFTFVFCKVSFLIILFYFILITTVLYMFFNKQKKGFLILFLVLMIHYLYPSFIKRDMVVMIDVGQGDSILLVSNNKAMLIDTGGKVGRENISDSTIVYLKSIGIKKLDNILITHGDYDHMGEAINLVENFKVEKVIFNCGEFNELEQSLIKVLDKKKIPYYSCIKELNIDGNKLYFLNNKDYGNENDNSNIIYTKLNNHKFLFMGDAGVEVEQDLIEKYNLQNVDVLKVGHHGSKTSSSKEFINEINPKYSIISVGKNNRYGHPNKEVLNNLEDSKIYRTDKDGSIMFKINNNKLKIETYSP